MNEINKKKLVIKTLLEKEFTDLYESKYYLGSWCFNDLLVLDKKLKANRVHNYHWDNKDKFKKDFAYLDNLYNKILANSTKIFNNLHNLERDERYWRIILGPWLKFFIDVLFDRYNSIETLQTSNKNIFFNIYKYSKDEIVTDHFHHFYETFVTDSWNEMVFSECIKFKEIDYLEKNIYLKTKIPKSSKKDYLKKIFIFFQKRTPHLFTNITTVSSYMPFPTLLKLQYKLKQIPMIVEPKINLKKININNKKRDALKLFEPKNDFELFLTDQLKKHLPKIYLESFSKIRDFSLAFYPKNTQTIFTSTAYQANDAFKIWSAEKVFQGAKLYIGQHGGTFGISAINQTENHQIKISDKFFTWGWNKKSHKNVIPLPVLKLNKTKRKYKKNGNILLILGCVPRYFYNFFSMPIAGQYKNYLFNQLVFLENLNKNLLNKIKIREDVSSRAWGWKTESLFEEKGFKNNLDNKKSIYKQLEQSSLCICTHNGTVMLESLSLNFPTLIFWEKGHYEIRKEAVHDFDILKKAGIFHDSAESAARKVNLISKDIYGWWNSKEVKTAVDAFVKKYALTSKNDLTIWKNNLEG